MYRPMKSIFTYENKEWSSKLSFLGVDLSDRFFVGDRNPSHCCYPGSSSETTVPDSDDDDDDDDDNLNGKSVDSEEDDAKVFFDVHLKRDNVLAPRLVERRSRVCTAASLDISIVGQANMCSHRICQKCVYRLPS